MCVVALAIALKTYPKVVNGGQDARQLSLFLRKKKKTSRRRRRRRKESKDKEYGARIKILLGQKGSK